ncbi:DUF4383 domain-containing protein [Mycobacterium sp.]|uniref:DUF4383 domain-containing protein n=1 Tax=Mycobacterium sp. TaxID=1785 RepID=UPI0025DC453C|nr:DUF4383 domain-containing protein [Mycobacterium sp.]MBW0013968.1 DUF4383 domain-containing protein [Mycobacterium sp.]
MPVTAGHVPGLTSGLRRVPTDPAHFRSGRWFLLAEGALVSAFGIAGLISAALHPNAGPTGMPVLGLASTAAHSALLLAFGVVAMAAVANRRAAVTVTAVSAVGYTMLLFFSSISTARNMPTPLGFHAADIVLHGVLAVVNLGLLMWLIPDELGDEAWTPRRRQGHVRVRRQQSTSASAEPAVRVQESAAHPGPGDDPMPRERPVLLERSPTRETHERAAQDVENPKLNQRAPRAVVPGAVAILAVVGIAVGLIVWRNRHRRSRTRT